jgi:predicted dehydrogenase
MTEPVVVAVVGVGGWGQNLLRNFGTLPGARLAWVCDLAEPARAAAAAAYPSARCVEDYQSAFADPAVQAVVIATDARSHHEVASAALRAGKDVFVEKPLALSTVHAEDLCDLADRGDRILMVGHLLLYHPALDALRRLIEDGELGEILYLYAQRLNLGVVRRDENAWWSLAPHDVSVANYLLGAEPDSVSATGGTFLQRPTDIEDVVFATLQYPGRRLAHIHVSWLDPHKTRRLTVVGSKKMAVFDDASADQKLVLFDKGVEPPHAVSYAEGVRIRTGDIRIPALRMQEPLRRECEAFLRAVQTREPPLADGRSGLAVVRVLEAGTRSLKGPAKGSPSDNPGPR